MSKRGLGRGLEALLPTSLPAAPGDEQGAEKVVEVRVQDIRVNKKQPRHRFDEEKLQELALSIKEHGVVQPIIVRPAGQGKYELVAGERRWRACRLLGQDRIPAIVKNLSEKETSEIALIENIQREDLNPIEEANAYKTLMEEHGLTQEEVSQRVGKSRPFIANAVRLLSLPESVRDMLAQGQLTAGHARALLALPGAKLQTEVAAGIVRKGMSVRQAEKAVRDLLKGKSAGRRRAEPAPTLYKDIENQLTERLCTRVRINHGARRGTIEIEYYGEDDLQRLLEALLGELE